jgi:hypothetical protein
MMASHPVLAHLAAGFYNGGYIERNAFLRLPVPRQDLFRKWILGNVTLRAQYNQESPDLLLEDDDERNESKADELPDQCADQLHVEDFDADPVQCIDDQQPDENIDSYSATQKIVKLVEEERDDSNIDQVDEANGEKADVEEIHCSREGKESMVE